MIIIIIIYYYDSEYILTLDFFQMTTSEILLIKWILATFDVLEFNAVILSCQTNEKTYFKAFLKLELFIWNASFPPLEMKNPFWSLQSFCEKVICLSG